MESTSKESTSKTINAPKPVQYGWICPVCGRGNSPFTSTCPCKPLDWNLTYGATACSPLWKYIYTTSTTGGTVNETR